MKVYLAALYGFGGWLDDTLKEYIKELEMRIYLAGAGTGNNNYLWKQNANTNPNEPMKLFLAGLHSENSRANKEDDFKDKISVLESFYYVADWMLPYIQNHWDFLLDSGAFTFMSDKKNANGVKWDEYVERYAHFINQNNISKFFELDIDSIVGITEVERLREKLHKLTNRQSIPVFHKERGKDYWQRMISEFNYVAIGGIVAGGLAYRKQVEQVLPWFLKTAKEKNCRVHGLGYTSIDGLKKFKFYSVDSTAWLYGNRGGFLYFFDGTTLQKKSVPNGMRLKGREAAIHNFKEWVKLQKYAKEYL